MIRFECPMNKNKLHVAVLATLGVPGISCCHYVYNSFCATIEVRGIPAEAMIRCFYEEVYHRKG